MNKQQQMMLFNLFHDGSLSVFQRKGDDIEFQMEIVYLAAMINPSYTYFQGFLKNCRRCVFVPWENEKSFYQDINMISTLLLDMEISNASIEDNYMSIHCLGGPRASGGSLKIICDTILLFSEGGEEVTLDNLQEVAQRYWNG